MSSLTRKLWFSNKGFEAELEANLAPLYKTKRSLQMLDDQ